MTIPFLLVALLFTTSPLIAQTLEHQAFDLPEPAEVVATITARCEQCDWAVPGREAMLLDLRLDGEYSQHLILTRGATTAPYRVMLGALPAGPHALTITVDGQRSARAAGPAVIESIAVRPVTPADPDYDWLSRAPFLHARPGTIEHFSDVPLLMAAELDVRGESGDPYAVQYTVVFTNEDGGTPTDRLMATWGRTTDIEFVYGVTAAAGGRPARQIVQADGHRMLDFSGTRVGGHPELWVATENNMVADRGPAELIRFAPAPVLVNLTNVSREEMMDVEAWTYQVTSSEMRREGRVESRPQPGSGRISDPRRYVVVEACAEVANATLAFALGVPSSSGTMVWYASDSAGPAFRIARGGCFRGGVALPDGVSTDRVTEVRVRAFPRGASGSMTAQGQVVIKRINQLLTLDEMFLPRHLPIGWTGTMPIAIGGESPAIPLPRPQ